MEDIKITINEKRPELRLLKKPSFWLVTLCAITAAVTAAIYGNYSCAIWALVAAGSHAGAQIFEMYADDLAALSYDLAKELDTMTDVLKEKEAEIIDLKLTNGMTEVNGIKVGDWVRIEGYPHNNPLLVTGFKKVSGRFHAVLMNPYYADDYIDCIVSKLEKQ